ncbi:MAG: hypothetical protein ABIB55_02595 [Candidatus Nealsonbacteria bacterium]
MAKAIWRLVKSFYSIKNPELSRIDLVVPLGYALLNGGELPDAAEKTLQEAVRIAIKYQAPIAFASTSYFGSARQGTESQLRASRIRAAGFAGKVMIGKGAINSVTEAQGIRQAVIKVGIIRGKRIVIVADWPHARSVRRIWRQVFPDANIVMVSVEGRWNEAHPCFFQRSESRWLFVNIVRHLGLIVLGTKIVGLFYQPTQ